MRRRTGIAGRDASSCSRRIALRKEFGGLVAVNDVDFTIPLGSIVSLIGPNGAGKTTFFNMITGVYKPTDGRVDLRRQGHRRQASACRHRARHRPHVPEHPALPADDVRRERARRHALPASQAASSRASSGSPGFGARSVRRGERARELLAYCGLAGHEDEYARNLSYGDQRRLEVARALATQPKLLLLDEPTAGMNPQETAEFVDFIFRMREDEKLTILLIEHDMKLVMGVSDRVTVLEYGAKIAEGDAEGSPVGPAGDRGVSREGGCVVSRDRHVRERARPRARCDRDVLRHDPCAARASRSRCARARS